MESSTEQNVEQNVSINTPTGSTPSSSTRTRKRKAEEQIEGGNTKKLHVGVVSASTTAAKKTYAIFSKTPAAFRFLKRIENTVLHGVHLTPVHHPKVAAFDLDDTLIRTKNGDPYPQGEHDWQWLYAAIPVRLKGLHDEGYSIVFISNQRGLKGKTNKRRDAWERKIANMAKELPEVPFRIMAAMHDDRFRKPKVGIWDELKRLYGQQDVTIDSDQSFYVGDAAGRPDDHSDADIGFAANVNLMFYTPEEYWHPLPSTLPDSASSPTKDTPGTPTNHVPSRQSVGASY